MDITELKAYNIFVAIRSIRKKFVASAFSKWKMLVQLLAMASNASAENMKMQLLEFKYRFKVSSQRVKSLEREIIELTKDVAQRDIVYTQESGRLALELEIAVNRAIGAENLIQKLEDEVYKSYGLQEPTRKFSISSRRKSLTPDDDKVVPTNSDLSSSAVSEISPGLKTIDNNDSFEKEQIEAEWKNRGLKMALVSLNVIYKTFGKSISLKSAFHLWALQTAAQRSIYVCKKDLTNFKRQNSAYQSEVKAHWAKSEEYMKKLKEKVDDGKKKREQMRLELENSETVKKSLLSNLSSCQLEMEKMREHIDRLERDQTTALDATGAAAQQEILSLRMQTDAFAADLETEQNSHSATRQSLSLLYNTVKEFKQLDEEEDIVLQKLLLALQVEVPVTKGLPFNQNRNSSSSLELGSNSADDRYSTPYLKVKSQIVDTAIQTGPDTLRRPEASTTANKMAKKKERSRSLYASAKDAESLFTSASMKKYGSTLGTYPSGDLDDDDNFVIKVPDFAELVSELSAAGTTVEGADDVEYSSISSVLIFNPAVENAMNTPIPTKSHSKPPKPEKPVVHANKKNDGSISTTTTHIPSATSVSTLQKVDTVNRSANQPTITLPVHHPISSSMTMNDFESSLEDVWNQISSQSVDSSPAASNVRVAIRMRPLNSRESEMASSRAVIMDGSNVKLTEPDTLTEHKFGFDFCFDAAESAEEKLTAGSQRIVFNKLGMEVLSHAWHGYNACLFAYGQTGSGKSYSMMGSPQDSGIIPRVCRALFYMIVRQSEGSDARNYSVDASYLEIYNENVRDLLDPTRVNLRVREHPTTGVFVENLSSCAVECYKDVEDLLAMGLEQRTTASTNMNMESSRSHSVFTISVRSSPMSGLADADQTNVRLSKLSLVDLAGSERASATGATGARLKEGANINKSLSTLGRCISALAKLAAGGGRPSVSGARSSSSSTPLPPKAPPVIVPFRESTLTWLLRESLCGNAKTSMLATISPADIYIGETLSTLRYAHSAKQISTQAVVNEDPTSKIIVDLRNEVQRLRDQLAEAASSSRPALNNKRIKDSLSHAEIALKSYAKAWESKQQSMKNVKRKLLNRNVSTFGAEDMEQEDLLSTPYLVFLSNDPQLNLAVKVYLPKGNKLKIGRAVSGAFLGSSSVDEESDSKANSGDEKMLDLQIDGLGIEDLHCVLSHDDGGTESSVSLMPELDAETYINGKPLKVAHSDLDSDSIYSLHRARGAMDGDGTYSKIVRSANKTQSLELQADTVKSKTRNSSIIHGKTVLKGGDILVLGECSHVFVFVTPDIAAGVENGKFLMPTYNQAVREVILGRVESIDERKRRVATRMINLWRKPTHKKYFEELFIDALKSVREATKIVNRLFPDMGMFFKVTVSSIIDLSSLYSLSIQDLCDYNNLTIRIRLYEIVRSKSIAPLNFLSSPAAKEASINVESRPPLANSPAFRPISMSRRDKNIFDISSSTPPTSSASFKHMSMSLRDGGLSGALATSAAATPTVVEAALYVDPDSCRVLLETTLNSFYDGLTVLRTLFSTIVPLMSYLQTIKHSKDSSVFLSRNKSVVQSLFQSPVLSNSDEGTGQASRISEFISTVVQILDHDRVSVDINIDEDKDLSAYSCIELCSYCSIGVECIQNSLLNHGLRGDIFKRKCLKQCLAGGAIKGNSAISEFVFILVESLEICLYKSVISCFEASGNLVIKDESKMDTDEREDYDNTGESDLRQKQDEVRLLLRAFSELRQDKRIALVQKTGAISYVNTEHDVLPKIQDMNSNSNLAMNSEQLHPENTLPSTDSAAMYENSADSSAPEHALDNVAASRDHYHLYDGADDWTVCKDESTGYSYIYSAKLQESRWLPT